MSAQATELVVLGAAVALSYGTWLVRRVRRRTVLLRCEGCQKWVPEHRLWLRVDGKPVHGKLSCGPVNVRERSTRAEIPQHDITEN